ncbi:hypothetical protein FE257_013074 [Aspergillus nanangensis]|uniref:2EXR domain-containing protein n=1 Tax=Aspergillus nanangensis TaxID=2582783 RepID=A0AAD4CEZ4_ASPNN|nr:hypothetical protein FE257_013074 [Aspergillus nanangensis]
MSDPSLEPPKPFPFLDLPFEIRQIIWTLCIPARIFEVLPRHSWANPDADCNYAATSDLNWRMPTLGYVCRESRSLVLKTGQWEPGHCWFNPTLDIPFMQWIPEDSQTIWGSDEDLNPDHLQYQGRGRGMGIVARRILDFKTRASAIDNWINEDLKVLAESEKEWLITVRDIVIHTTIKAGRRSGLFGLLGDTPIQLVEPTDTATIEKYCELWASGQHRLPDAGEFFNDQAGFHRRLREWVIEVETIWVWNQWWDRCDAGKFEGIPDPENVWLGPPYKRNDESIDWNLLSTTDLSTSMDMFSECYNLDMERFSLHKEHPFVQECLARMPRFHPRVMFRLCPDKCPTQPNLRPSMATYE